MAFQRIILATDFSEGAERATDVAIAVATQFGATITVIHVYSVPAMPYTEGIAFPLAEVEAAAKEALSETVGRIQQRWAKTESVLVFGVAWQQIIAAVEERGGDLVVMGTHGRRGLMRALLGSVAEKVVRMSPVPVLAVPGPRKSDK